MRLIAPARLRWALAATLAACVWVALLDDTAPPAPTERTTQGANNAASPPLPRAQANQTPVVFWPSAPDMQPADQAWPPLNARTRLAWAPAPPPPPPPPPPPVIRPVVVPPPPAFPYRWLGQLAQADAPALALLGGPQNSLAVPVNGLIDGQWKLQSMQAHQLVLVWLPTGQTVNLKNTP